MKNSSVIRLLAVLLLSLLAVGCVSNSSRGPTLQQYSEMTNEEKVIAKEIVIALRDVYPDWWTNIGKPLYDAHLPVPYVGADGTEYTMQWIKKPGDYDEVTVYQSHDPNGISGNVKEAMYSHLADKEGNILYKKDGKTGAISPNKLLADVSNSEDIGKTIVKGLFRMGSSAVNGVGAAQIRANNTCTQDCGNGTQVLNQVMSTSSADAKGVGTASASLTNGCTDCIE